MSRRTLSVPDDPHGAVLKLIDRYGLEKIVTIVMAIARENEAPRRPEEGPG
jgi:hypothetical protein